MTSQTVFYVSLWIQAFSRPLKGILEAFLFFLCPKCGHHRGFGTCSTSKARTVVERPMFQWAESVLTTLQ